MASKGHINVNVSGDDGDGINKAKWALKRQQTIRDNRRRREAQAIKLGRAGRKRRLP